MFTSAALVFVWSTGQLPGAVNYGLWRLSWFWVVTEFDLSPRLIFSVSLLLFAGVGLLLISKVRQSDSMTRLMNLFALVLLVFPVGEIIRTKLLVPAAKQAVPNPLTLPPRPAKCPDIYYIILDGYAQFGRHARALQLRQYRVSQQAGAKGFFLARRSTANYCQTPLSLASSLNLDYLDDLVKGTGSDLLPLHGLIARNRLASSLRPLGYRFVTFSTGFEASDVTDSDNYLSPYPQFTEFQRLLIDHTPIWAFLSLAESRDLFTQAHDRTLYLLDHLPKVAEDPRPTLTLAHIVSPHPPFLFGEKGEDISRRDKNFYLNDGCRYQGISSNPEAYIRGYHDQAVYITRRIEQVIDQILAKSPEPPIVILQADHGSGLRLVMESKEQSDLHERMSILNAYFFPDRNYRGLYAEITPVNSFRVVLNTFFGAGLPLLQDRNYFSTWSHPYDFMNVTDSVGTPTAENPVSSRLTGVSPRKSPGSEPSGTP